MRKLWRILIAVILLIWLIVPLSFAEPRANIERACREYVLSQLQSAPEDVEIKFRRYIEPAIDWSKVALEVSHPRSADLCGTVTLRVAAIKKGKTLRSFPVPIQVTLYDSVMVFTRRHRRHDVLTAGDIALERREIKLGRDAPYTDPAEVIGRRTTRSLSPGRLVTRSTIEEVPLVKRGQKVTVRFQTGSLLLTVLGEAIEDGWQGRTVRVKNLSSKRLITGVATDVGLVDVLRPIDGG